MFAELARRHEHLDVLVNNAGIAGPTAPIDTHDEDGWNECIQVNLSGTFYVTKRAVPLLRKSGGGAIINISSTAALYGYPLRSAYAASKWAMMGLMKTWAMELGPEGIRVNTVCNACCDFCCATGVLPDLAEAVHEQPVLGLSRWHCELRFDVDRRGDGQRRWQEGLYLIGSEIVLFALQTISSLTTACFLCSLRSGLRCATWAWTRASTSPAPPSSCWPSTRRRCTTAVA